MLRRVAVHFPLAALVAGRYYTPSAELKKLYASDFEKASFPTTIVPSDSVLFAKFLYKAAESKNSYDAVLKDLQTITAAVPKLPVFWERTCRVDEIKEFKGLSEPTLFTLEWMQSNGMLDLLPDVADVYETYVNAKLKRAVTKVYVGPSKKDDKATMDSAKKLAEQLLQENKELAGFKLSYKVVVDRTIVDGFAVELQGMYINQAKGQRVEERAADESDYTTVPLPHLPKTTWEDNIETEVLRSYIDSLAAYDAEELKYGV